VSLVVSLAALKAVPKVAQLVDSLVVPKAVLKVERRAVVKVEKWVVSLVDYLVVNLAALWVVPKVVLLVDHLVVQKAVLKAERKVAV
jgi:hypothetical protein